MQSQRIVDEGYQLNPEAGDINIEWAYEPQVYEGYRIGTRYNGVYPIKARPIAYQRDGKLPYNGIQEVENDIQEYKEKVSDFLKCKNQQE